MIKKRLYLYIFVGIIFIMAACTTVKPVDKSIILSDDVPKYVQEDDFTKINWKRKAIEFGNRGIIGNENKSGVIGIKMPSLTTQKWMWHIWGIDSIKKPTLTVVGFHKESKTVHQILVNGWTTDLGGANNGADAHTPSSVKVPKKGEWAFLLYLDEKLFDTIIYDIEK
ncbi:hypothetical protein [Bacillus sp. JJ722]|uniref:hypothetical protein n=1 Tax=Bacillus sp. JJ722 TaxID=3122973 RepID=UPI002FFE91AE